MVALFVALGAPLVLAAPVFAADGDIVKTQDFIRNVIKVAAGFAGLIAAGFFVVGGFGYITSSGNPDNLQQAKKIIKNALIGLVLVLAAGTLTAILSHAYSGGGTVGADQFPTLQPIEPKDNGFNLFDVVINAIVSVLRNIVQ